MNLLVAQRARLCAAHRTRAKWAFVAAHALGRTLGERMALERTDRASLRFRQDGREEQGWRGAGFFWPVICVPANVKTAIVAQETIACAAMRLG